MTNGDWTPAGAPGPGDTAQFDLGNTGVPYVVRLDAVRTIDELMVRNDTIELDLFGNALTLTDLVFGLTVGRDSGETGHLTISNSGASLGTLQGTCGVTCSAVVIGYLTGSWGRLSLTDAVDLSGFDVMWVGNDGDGILEMSNGATMTVAGPVYAGSSSASTGSITVDGAGTLLQADELGVGYQGFGELFITNGGVVTTTADAYTTNIGVSSGQMTITGSDSALNAGDDFILNEGWLDISSGGVLDSPDLVIIGNESGTNTWAAVADSTSAITAYKLYVGKGGTGRLDVLDGAGVTATNVYIGSDTTGAYTTGIGTLAVSGAGSSCTTGFMAIGYNMDGAGTLSASGGGVVSCTSVGVDASSGLNSLIDVRDPDSRLDVTGNINLGIGGDVSDLNVLNGGVVTCADLNIAPSTSATSTIHVTGDQAMLECSGSMYVPGKVNSSYGGAASLTVDGSGLGGTNQGASVQIGEQLWIRGGADVTLVHNFATTTPSAPIVLSYGGNHLEVGVGSTTGTINMHNEGSLTMYDACIGCNVGDTGTVSMWNNPGPIWDGKNLSIGAYGNGSFTVRNGSAVGVTYAFVGRETGSSGSLEVSFSGTFVADGSMYIGCSTAGSGGTGLLDLYGGGTVTVGQNLLLGPGGTIDMSIAGQIAVGSTGVVPGVLLVGPGGTLGGSGQVNADVQVTLGTIAPGLSTGTLTLNQSVTFDDSTQLEFELGTSGADKIRITSGTYTNVGAVEVSVFDAGGLDEGQSYTLIDWTGASTVDVDVADFSLVDSPINGTFSIVGSTLVFEIPAACPSDVTGDGLVDVVDLLDLLAAWGACDGCPEDVDDNGVVDVVDLLDLLAAWGTCP